MLVLVGSVRELLGSGTLLGFGVLPLAAEGGWYEPIELMGSAASAFFVIGFAIWALRALRPAPLDDAPIEGGA